MKNGKNQTGVRHKFARKDAPKPIKDRLQTLLETRPKRGRKSIGESRATEIRLRLVEWKRVHESMRISLRALAAEMGTSHQLLSFYLKRLNYWQIGEYKRKENDIRVRAECEGRPVAGAEQEQALAYARASSQALYDCLISGIVSSCLIEVKRGTKLPPSMHSAMRNLAHKGDRKAQEVLEVQENLPRSAPRVAKSFKAAVAADQISYIAGQLPRGKQIPCEGRTRS